MYNTSLTRITAPTCITIYCMVLYYLILHYAASYNIGLLYIANEVFTLDCFTQLLAALNCTDPQQTPLDCFTQCLKISSVKLFRIDLYFTLVCTSTFKYFIDFVHRNQWPLGDILDKKFSYAIVLALLPWQLSSSAIFTCMTGCINAWKTIAWKTIAWNCRVGLLAACFGHAISEFHDKPYYFYIKYVGFWLAYDVCARAMRLFIRVGHAIFDLHD